MRQTLLEWVERVEVDTEVREGVTTSEARRVLERELNELRRANEILKLAIALFAQAEFDRRLKSYGNFIDSHRDVFGVEPICNALQVAPLGYRRDAAARA